MSLKIKNQVVSIVRAFAVAAIVVCASVALCDNGSDVVTTNLTDCTLTAEQAIDGTVSGFDLDSIVDAMDSPTSSVRRAIHLIQQISGVIFSFLIVLMLILSNIDHRHPRRQKEQKPVSIVVPCYNDGLSVGDTIVSVFRTYPADMVDLIVINDCSKDDSLERIKELQKKYPFRIVDNERNKGKAKSLNDTIPMAKYEYVLCLDADTLLNKPALFDMMARMDNDQRLGAVSCPYRPRNKGFLPILQAVEYSMLLLTQGAHNLTSAMALWGGCLMVRKTAFDEVEGFYLNAITEDVDLAFRMNRHNWRVEQSFRAVRSLVPHTFKAWVRQKLRWTSGGTQCYYRHIPVWIKNPIQIFFIFSYSFLLASTIPTLFDKIEIVQSFDATWSGSQSFWQNLIAVNTAVGADVFRRLMGIGLCYIPSFIYIIPMVRTWCDIWKFILVVPFSLIYFPVYMVVSLCGMAIGIRSLLVPKNKDTQGWA